MNLTFVCFLVALLIGGGSLQAQDERRDYSEQKMKLRAEMMALNMAEKYGLDERQIEKLTEANLLWLQQQGDELKGPRDPRAWTDRRWAAHRPHPRHHRGGCCAAPCQPRPVCDSCCEDGHHAPGCPYVDGKRAPLSNEEVEKLRAERKQAFEKRKTARDAYEQSLKEIMTDEQYQAYRTRK